MKSFLLLLLSLMTGSEASFKLKTCGKRWTEFTWNCTSSDRNYDCIVVDRPIGTPTQSSESDVWQTQGNVSFCNDTRKEQIKKVINQLREPKNSRETECKFCPEQTSSSEEDNQQEVGVEDSCQKPFIQTAYRTAKTTIKCDHSENQNKAGVFCKENYATYEDILFAPKSNRRFSLTVTSSGFSMSISKVSSHDAGVYWCGVVQNEGRAALRKIRLKVEGITNFTKSATSGQNFTYWCKYPDGSPVSKFICKGEDPSICEPLANTGNTHNNTRFVMKDNKLKTNSTITVRNVKADDAGTYWCGAKNTDGKQSNPFYHRFNMTVVPPTTSTPSSSFLDRDGGFWLIVIIAATVSVAVLLLTLILILLCKRFKRSKNIRNGEPQNNKEDGAYEEIQERDSGTALKTIYVTADLPSKPSSASHQYSNITFQNNSGEVRDDSYYTVRGKDQHPAYSTVNHPTRMFEDPFYSTVNSVRRPL
uniref:uncharacterized protein LOC124057030 n=1 Tax=Scatophagus argus TaxID=75038 RepID=UPI001ED7F09B|nr:uncharacterized protein LOC124057030 [Scatophagus argus]